MSAVGDLAQVLAQVAGQITAALTQLTAAQDELDEGSDALRFALDGSNDPDVLDMLGALEPTSENLIHAYQVAKRAHEAIETYRKSLEVQVAVDSTPPSAAHPSATKSQGIQESAKDPKWARDRLAELPKRGVGGPTHGTFVDTDGTHTPLVSGTDRESHTASLTLINSENFPDMPTPDGSPDVARHVETKAAQRMRDSGQTFGVVVVNNSVCGGDYGCRSAISAILPEGTSLVVWEPDSTSPITLHGKARP